MSDNLLQRILVGVIFAPLIFFSAIYVKSIFALIVLVLIVGSLKEFFILLDAPDSSLYSITGYVFGVLIFIDVLFFGGRFIQFILLAFIIVLSSLFFVRRSENWMKDIIATFSGTVYISLFYSVMLLIMSVVDARIEEPHAGGKIVSLIILCVWSLDTSAYFIGKNFGKHSFFQFISPKKTVEGALGGFVGAVGVTVIAQQLYIPFLNIWGAVSIAVMVGIFGQIGDLLESAVKRETGAKDSSSIIPGHGGMLDRFDSLLFVTPIVYVYIKHFLF
ncbi:phosphatidate cytidylyltransferase [bacterium]|nr:phosphatidate cytidylyltransferase [bacterium]